MISLFTYFQYFLQPNMPKDKLLLAPEELNIGSLVPISIGRSPGILRQEAKKCRRYDIKSL